MDELRKIVEEMREEREKRDTLNQAFNDLRQTVISNNTVEATAEGTESP